MYYVFYLVQINVCLKYSCCTKSAYAYIFIAAYLINFRVLLYL